MSATDLLGRPLTPVEADLLDAYRRLETLAAREDTPPCLHANVRFALAALWQAVNDLGLDHAIDELS